MKRSTQMETGCLTAIMGWHFGAICMSEKCYKDVPFFGNGKIVFVVSCALNLIFIVKSIMTNAEATHQTTALTVTQALQRAIDHQRAGILQEAKRPYRVIIQAHPKNPDASQNLGLLTSLARQFDAGPHFKTAWEANPKQGQFWQSYLDARHVQAQGR